MVVKLKDTMKKLRNYLDKSSRLKSAGIGEPLKPPEDLHGAVILGPSRAKPGQETTLDGSIEERSLIVRIYINGLREPREDIEFDLDEAAANLHSDILGDFDLGGDIRNVEPAGITTTPGWQSIGGVMFRIIDILIPMTVDDNAAMAK